jgi:hypothetical protein
MPDNSLALTSDEGDSGFTGRTKQIDQPCFEFPPKRAGVNAVNGLFISRLLVAHV